jgi:glyoxalase family protein
MPGLHHVTAIAGDPIRNFGFYTRDLGLRFVKKTVNFDDPGTYHFYYGDETGRPGTILTFFPWSGARPGRRGVGETHQTAFRVPQRSLGYWTQRLTEKGIAYEALEKRFGESRTSPATATATFRPSMRSAASTASPCCSTPRRRPPLS